MNARPKLLAGEHYPKALVRRAPYVGWVKEALLDNILIKELNSIPINAITSPIRISSGFLILKKNNQKEEEKETNLEEELTKLINLEKEKQLKSFSNLYFNKIKNDQKINFP